MGVLIEGAMQQAAQAGRQSMGAIVGPDWVPDARDEATESPTEGKPWVKWKVAQK